MVTGYAKLAGAVFEYAKCGRRLCEAGTTGPEVAAWFAYTSTRVSLMMKW